MLNKNLFRRMADWAVENTDPAMRPMPNQVTQPKVQVIKKGYKGFFMKEAQKQAKERDIYREKLRKEEEERKALKKKKGASMFSSQPASQMSQITQSVGQ